MNKQKVIDALNGIKTKDGFDAKHCAEYLWTWSDIWSTANARSYIDQELDKMDKISKTDAEHIEFCKKNYKKILDKFYKEVQTEANKILQDGYKNLDNYYKNA